MSPNYRRLDRINSLLQAEISDIIRRELKDPRLGFISIIGVETSGDLRHARIRVSVLGTPEEKKASLEGLARAASFVRESLLHRLQIRRIPQLDFVLDENIEYSIHISEVLEKLKPPAGEGHE